MPMPVLSILFIASQSKSRITCHYAFYIVITRNITNSLLASGKPINFVSLHLKNHQNFKGVITKEYSISRQLPVPTYKHY